MAWSVSADPVDFKEALEWFRKRVSVSRAEFARLSAVQKRKAFTVANVAQLDLVNQVWKAIDAALEKGTPLADFKKAIGPDLRKAWSGTVDDPAWRLESIFRTNIQHSYAAGRFKQATHPDVISDRPVWMFDAILDGRETEICKDCDATKRPANDTWWLKHTPPLHYNCRSSIITHTEDEGITLHPPKAKAQSGFGVTPSSDEWTPDATKYPPPLAKVFVAKQKKAPPPPPPPRLKAKKHMLDLDTKGVSSDELTALLGSISDAETLRFLEGTPLSTLYVRPGLKAPDGDRVNGLYWRAPGKLYDRKLDLAADRRDDTFGKAWIPKVSWSVSSAGLTKTQAVQLTLRHELGHHVHMHDGDHSAVDKIVASAFKRAVKADNFITRYAGANHLEYFAESYVAYYHRRADLKQHDPNGYAMVEDVLRERGILT